MAGPESSRAIGRLTEAVGAAFLECPPYGGAFDEVVRHLTVAERRFADLATLKGVERVVLAGLPLVARIERVLLIAGTQAPNSWTILSELRLGTSTSRPQSVPQAKSVAGARDQFPTAGSSRGGVGHAIGASIASRIDRPLRVAGVLRI